MTEAEFRALKPGDVIKCNGVNPCTIVRVDDDGLQLEWQYGGETRTCKERYRYADSYTLVSKSQSETHYTVDGIPEAWEVIEALQSAWPEDVRYHVGNVLKYVFRLGRKQGASVESDLEKIRNYADRALKVLGKK